MQRHPQFLFILIPVFFAMGCHNKAPSFGSGTNQSAGCSHPTVGAGTYSGLTISSGGRTRTYDVYIPATYSSNSPQPLPVIYGFHGGGSNSNEIKLLHALYPTRADNNNYIVVAPNGTASSGSLYTWNAGTCCGYAVTNNVDDVSFFLALMDQIEADYCVDKSREYVEGFSNGGLLAQRLACDATASARIAGLGAIEAGMQNVTSNGGTPVYTCQPSHPIPVFEVNGTPAVAPATIPATTPDTSADSCMPRYGGYTTGSTSGTPQGWRTPIDTTINTWVSLDECGSTPTSGEVGTASCKTYSGCNSGAEIVYCLIVGGGHWFPGSPRVATPYTLASSCGGNSPDGFAAADEMWAFFQRHSL